MEIEVRFAQSGHCNIFSTVDSVSNLMNAIKNQYKIQLNDQKLISKDGVRLLSHQIFQGPDNMIKTFVQDKMQSSIKQTIAIYLFNQKSLLKQHLSQSKIYVDYAECLQALQSRCKCLNDLKPNVYQLRPLSESQMSELRATHADIANLTHTYHRQSIMVAGMVTQFNSIKYSIEQIIHLCQNQRKSITALHRYLLKIYEQDKKKTIETDKKIIAFLDGFQIGTQRNSQRSIKNHNENKTKIYRNCAQFRRKIQELKDKQKTTENRLKEQRKRYKQKFRHLDEDIKIIDGKNVNAEKQIKNILQETKILYSKFIDQVKEFKAGKNCNTDVDGFYNQGCIKNSVRNIEKMKEQIKRFILQAKQDFCKLYTSNKKAEQLVRQFYRNANEIQTNLENSHSQQLKLDRQVSKYFKAIDDKTEENNIDANGSQSVQQQQAIIRSAYDKKINQLVESILELREKQYKRRMVWIQQNNISSTNGIQKLIDLPQIQIKTTPISEKQFRPKHYTYFNKENIQQLSNQQISQVLQDVKNLTKKVENFNCEKQSDRCRNLQQILQNSSKIFHDLYQHKTKILQKQFQQKTNRHLQDIQRVKFENQKLCSEKYEVLKKLENQLTILNEVKSKCRFYQQRNRQLQSANQELETRLNEASDKIIKLELQLQKQSDQNSKYQHLTKQIKSQFKLINTLSDELQIVQKNQQNLQKQNLELKDLLAQYQLAVFQLEEQRKRSKQNQDSKKSNSIQHKDIFSSSQKQSQDGQINSEDFKELKAQNKHLNQEVQRLQDEINKIILKDVQDVQIQVNESEEKFETHRFGSSLQKTIQNPVNMICLNCIKPGELCLFLPFQHDVYIGLIGSPRNWQTNFVTHKNSSQSYGLYRLNMKFIPSRARNLLTQCPLIVVAKILNIVEDNQINWVEGQIQYALGFEDDNKQIKNYACHFYE